MDKTKKRHFSSTTILKILIVIFSLSFLVKLGSSPLLEIDEAIYAEVAREAFVSGTTSVLIIILKLSFQNHLFNIGFFKYPTQFLE